VSGLEGRLPFTIDDASRAESEKEANPDAQFNRVLLDTRLNNRVVDLRVR
jgi:aspartyl-tRNA synthetase